jgi:hypothetical protein
MESGLLLCRFLSSASPRAGFREAGGPVRRWDGKAPQTNFAVNDDILNSGAAARLSGRKNPFAAGP